MGDGALNLAQVLSDERAALEGKPLWSKLSADKTRDPEVQIGERKKKFSDLDKSDLNDIYRELNRDNRWALCLSGGGMRSAAFALGIVQCFAARTVVAKRGAPTPGPLLTQFDYLSTVSGGGYLGSWLSAWLYQARHTKDGAYTVLKGLADRIGDHDEAEPITNLRRDSHYLAPSFSALSPDVWADVATVVRNLMLNWLLLIPPLILAVVATKAFAYGFQDLAMWSDSQKSHHWVIFVAGTAAAIFIIISLSFATANRPTREIVNFRQELFLWCDLGAFAIGATLLIFILATRHGRQWTFGNGVGASVEALVASAVLGSLAYLVSWFGAFLWPRIGSWASRIMPDTQVAPGDKALDRHVEQNKNVGQRQQDVEAWQVVVALAAWCGSGVVFGILIGLGYLFLHGVIVSNSHLAHNLEVRSLIAVVLGIPGVLGARIVADVVFVAIIGPIPKSDGDLEYQARASGIYTLVLIGWIVWCGLILFGIFVDRSGRWGITPWLAGVGGISGAASLAMGASSKTGPLVQAATAARHYLGLNTLASIAAAIFSAVLIVAISIGVDRVLSPPTPVPERPALLITLVAGLVLLGIVAAVPWLININRFSLHGLYRNRLVRAFLGASRSEEKRCLTKNQFSDFDTHDSPRLCELWEHDVVPGGDRWKPLHVINVALNLVSSKNLAWQERMAAPFTFSPLHSGSGSSAFPQGAFRLNYPLREDNKAYGGLYGLTLGTAMAISGAAVSPNMGYNSSPGVAFLMTLFNVRLGWWLANPQTASAHYWYGSPGWALAPLFMEMFGLTSEKKDWVYLSDGGHFENLGLYEMVRRRCRLIVISDAVCDPEYEFKDLGNALRKIWIDLGIRVDFVGLDRLKKRFKERPTPATNEPYWAIGYIRYREADEDKGGAEQTCEDGVLFYIKAGLHGTESMDVLSYAMKHPTFPHESTANQFFNESQLEGYRRLGHEIATSALQYAQRERAAAAANRTKRAAILKQSLDDFLISECAMRVDEVAEHLAAQLARSAS